MEDNFFGPNVQLTRCMFITILHRMDGVPSSSVSTPFTDVPAGSYYEQAVKWAYENKISEGISKTEFGSEYPIRREEVVTMLYRYFTNYKEQTLEDKGGNTSFADAGDAAHHQMGHSFQIAYNGPAFNILAQCHGKGAGGAFHFLRFHNLPQHHRMQLFMGHFNADHGCAGNGHLQPHIARVHFPGHFILISGQQRNIQAGGDV